ncbi:MAG: hypothetical protein ABIT76_15565 [Chthoniobacterales bacterium]
MSHSHTHAIQRICLFLFFAVILAVGISDAALSWMGKKPPGTGVEPNMPRPEFRPKLLWKGEWTTDCEAWLRNRSWLVHGTGARYRELAFTWAGRNPSGVIVGKNDWLFSPETVEARSATFYQKQAATVADKLAEFDLRYRAMGMRLVILLIPNAATLYADQTPGWIEKEHERLAFLPEMTGKLRQKGLLVFNSTDAMRAAAARGAQVYFKGDHHWTFRGAQAASEGLAGYLRQTWPEMKTVADGQPIYRVDWAKRDFRTGSAARKFGFWQDSPTDNRFSDSVDDPTFTRLRTAPTEAGWLGTSFTGFNSAEFFANAAGMEVRRLDRPAKGSLFSSGAGLKYYESLAGPKPPLVVLEIPEYHLLGVAGRQAGFDRLDLGPPPWKAASEPLKVELKKLRGMTATGDGKHFTVTEKEASLELKLPAPVSDLEVALSLSRTRNKVSLQAKSARPRQGFYDDYGLLKYRFSRKKPSDTWVISWTNLDRGLTIEIGEVRQPLAK